MGADHFRGLDQYVEDRPGKTVQIRRLKPPRVNGSRNVIDIHHALKPHGNVFPTYSANQAVGLVA